MLSLDQCRRCLPENCTIPDSELELLRDQLYGLANVSVSAFVEHQCGNAVQTAPEAEVPALRGGDSVEYVQQAASFEQTVARLPEDDRCAVEERAAILEFDEGLPRAEAERAAFCDYWRQKRKSQSD